MKTLVLMQGLPGSGKTTVAVRIAEDGRYPIYSTDEFWISADDGSYNWDAGLLGVAHRWNQRRVLEAMRRGDEKIIVDNTNITHRDARPYTVLAEIFEYVVQVVRVQTDVETCVARQARRSEGRRVPSGIIRSMAGRMQDLTRKDY